MIPIGRGQRELIIGDRQTGKTAIAVDTIMNQKGQGRVSVSMWRSDRRQSTVAQIHGKDSGRIRGDGLHDDRGFAQPVEAGAAAVYRAVCRLCDRRGMDGAGQGCPDRLRRPVQTRGRLPHHCPCCLRRPPGREAYPGDVFYLHSRLLERAAKLSDELGGGSLTALPIIETQAGDVSAYIPTNVISITGRSDLSGDRTVQRGRAAGRQQQACPYPVSAVQRQTKAMKQVAGSLKLDLAQYHETG